MGLQDTFQPFCLWTSPAPCPEPAWGDNSTQQVGTRGPALPFPTGVLPAAEGESQSYIPSFIDASSSISYPSKVQSALNSPPRALMAKPSLQQGSQGSHPQMTSASSTQESIPGSAWSQSIRRLLARARLYSILPLNRGSPGTTPEALLPFQAGGKLRAALLRPAPLHRAPLICCQPRWRQEQSDNRGDNSQTPQSFHFT